MFQDFMFILIIAFVAFELIEHVLFPIIWHFLKRRSDTKHDSQGMTGKTVEIKSWDDKSGIVLFHAERWQAVADKPMQPGEKAIVEKASGLTLKIKPYTSTIDNQIRHSRVK
jgi:membrane-bound ClpP family serine protease